jgi:diguanylate cyclase (GGDEF)-like protein
MNSAKVPATLGEVQATVQNIVRRQWWLWSAAVLITILLTIGIASFAFPGLLSEREQSYAASLNLAVRGLVGLVLLFVVYVVYQQLQIHRMQAELRRQIDAFGKLEDRTEQVYKIAALDGLTGLYNRQCGEQRLAEEMLRSQRHRSVLTILLLDLNDLKRINDTFGHPVGDLVLKYFAERLQRAVRGSDVPVRLGGDEFLVILPECKVNQVQLVLNRLEHLGGDFDGQKISLEFAAGWTDYVPGETSQVMMARADALLYTNKRSGKEKREEKPAAEVSIPSPAAGKNGSASGEPMSTPTSALRPRELEVLKHLAWGKSNKEVADALGISVRTVETYRAKIMEQLNVHSAGELVIYAVRNKIIQVDSQ